jgi:uncharacterized protein (DUF488 family)
MRVTGIGYEGHTQADLIAALRAAGIATVADVRLNPVSRKPGLSKRGLAAALDEAGIAYLHLPALGNPRDARAAFHGSASRLPAARAHYAARLTTPEAQAALAEIRAAASPVALLCLEADESRCHRHVILEHLADHPDPCGCRRGGDAS